MPRPVNHERRVELLDGAVEYAMTHGFSELSGRPVAAALGVTMTTLTHHFGTKEQLLQAILARLRERILAATSELAGQNPTLPEAARAIWDWSADPQRREMFGLFFAVYGRALQAPKLFAEFRAHVVADWMGVLLDAQAPDAGPSEARRRATTVIAMIRGLLLDLLDTGDRDRVEDAFTAFLDQLAPRREPPTTIPALERER